jgi:hypothetical protein
MPVQCAASLRRLRRRAKYMLGRKVGMTKSTRQPRAGSQETFPVGSEGQRISCLRLLRGHAGSKRGVAPTAERTPYYSAVSTSDASPLARRRARDGRATGSQGDRRTHPRCTRGRGALSGGCGAPCRHRRQAMAATRIRRDQRHGAYACARCERVQDGLLDTGHEVFVSMGGDALLRRPSRVSDAPNVKALRLGGV